MTRRWWRSTCARNLLTRRIMIENTELKGTVIITAAGKHFMPADVELERIGIRIVVYPQDILAARRSRARSRRSGGGA